MSRKKKIIKNIEQSNNDKSLAGTSSIENTYPVAPFAKR
jgi:hypothetical protein